MTIEEKAKAYDEAIKRAKPLMLDTNFSMKNTVISIFPELKESEDEMLMNDIMEAVENWLPYERVEDIRAYLEKQKEQKPIAHENNYVSKPKTSLEILKHYLIWVENSEEDCLYTWKELAAAIKDGISALEQKPVINNGQQECPYKDLALVKDFFGKYKRKCKLFNKICDSKECEQWAELQSEFKRQ